MYFFSAILFGISANIDALVLGFSYGIRKQNISFFSNIILSFITFLGTFLSIGAGICLTEFFPKGTAKIVGSLLLILLGVYYCLKYMIQKRKESLTETPSMHLQSENILPVKESLLLGLTLTINNTGIGMVASLAGVHFLLTCFLTLILCFSFLFLGNRIGTHISIGFFQHSADLLAGTIIIVMGFFHCFL